MNIISIVNIEGEPIVIRSYTERAFIDRCNDNLHTNYTLEELDIAVTAFLKKNKHLEIHENKLIIEYIK